MLKIFLLATVVSALSACASMAPSFEKHNTAFYAARDRMVERRKSSSGYSDAEFVRDLRDQFDNDLRAFIEPEVIPTVSTTALRSLLDAAAEVVFYVKDMERAQIVEAIVNEANNRGPAQGVYYSELQHALLLTRQWQRAADIANAHPEFDLEHVPPAQPAPASVGALTYWNVSGDPDSLVELPFHFDDAAQIIVIAHPLCHFSQNATRSIEADPELERIFSGHAFWLSPVNRQLDFDVFKAWNHAHPHHPIALSNAESDWPLIAYWGTPTFYFFKRGRLIDTVTGWPPDGNKAALISAARRIGLE